MIEQGPPSESDLHAYIDGHLEPADAARVAAYLARHPETAALVEAYRAQTAGLHALYDQILDEPLPESMAALLRQRRSAGLWRGFMVAAAALALVMVSAGMGWWVDELRHGREAAPAPLVAEAQRAHRLFAGDDNWASDFAAPRGAGLAQFLSERIGAPVTLPEVGRAGLSLRGVRLVPTASGTAALLVYRDGAGQPASLFVASVAAADAPPRADGTADVTTLYRVANGTGYALTLSRASANPAIEVAFGMQPGR
jgi:anti-sigma factor RsiW